MSEEEKKPTMYLVDGSNYVFRAFYAIRHLSNSKGFPTNAVYGFATMLMKLLRDRKPDYIAVAFDLKGPTFRDEVYESYKANRAPTPDALIPQIPFIKDVVRGFSIPVIEKEGIEADDLIATLAKKYAEKGIKVFIVSGDKDFLQMVSEDITVVDTMKDRVYDIDGVKGRFGVAPEKVVDVLALTGDASDNIPGVPGIGDKTAQRLIAEFGSLEEVMGHLDGIKNARLKESIGRYADQARLGRQLVTLMTDADVEFDLEKARYRGPDPHLLKDIFKELEFASLLKELKVEDEGLEGDYRLVVGEEELRALAERLKEADQVSLVLEKTSDAAMQADIVGMALSFKEGEAFYIPMGHAYPGAPEQLPQEWVLRALAPFLADERLEKRGHDLKNDVILLSRKGVSLKGLGFDVMVAAYVLNPSKKDYGLEALVREGLDHELPVLQAPPASAPVEQALSHACRRADAVQRLSLTMSHQVEKDGFGDLFHGMEMPLIEVLASMERRGVLLDVGILREMSRQFEELLSRSEEKIYRLAGERFNIQSPKQLQQILFEKLALPRGKRTKAGFSTDFEVLLSLSQNHELPAEILAYRSIAKLKSTYVDALPGLINPETGRVHTSYNQTGTETGRLSSSNPNLQNIPTKTPEGRRIRQAFIAPPGYKILSADYSQIDLRVLAHLSGDRNLIEAFHADEDVHSRTAADVFGVFPEMVTPGMRRQAKVVNFGVIYGMSPFGLAKELGVSQSVARAYIDGYFARYSGVREYIERTLAEARRKGYVTTLMNRRRYLPEINSSNPAVRQFAERTAINTPIQGTSADLIKLAMVRIYREMERRGFSSGMIMQVHDELVFEVAEDEIESAVELIKEGMEGVASLRVPLKVGVSWGDNWDEAH
ncbi:MAG TPA: DNA polymerase I [Syntrophales bacterium]|nr:DNA polymerase I [Syntrophales bacterium]